MAFLQQLKKGKKLKQVEKEQIKDFSGPILEKNFNKKENDIKVLDYNIEAWSDLLEDVSMITKYCILTIEDGQHLHENYELTIKENCERTPELKAWVEDLTQRLQVTMDEMNASENGVFIKTSSRSPKDAPGVLEKLKELYADHLNQQPDKSETSQVRALLKALHECQKVYSAEEAMRLLLNSERIYADMKLALEYPDIWECNIVAREWKTIDFELEFRTFFNNGKLNAISHYSHFLYSDFVNKNSERIAAKLQEFFLNDVLPALKGRYEASVVDFGFEDESLENVYLIELNPWTPNSDTCLFKWGRDKELLHNGPMEVRYIEKPHTNIRMELNDEWLEHLDRLNSELGITTEKIGTN